MEDNINGERKKLSLSSGGKLTLKNSLSSKASSITTNSRSGRGQSKLKLKEPKELL